MSRPELPSLELLDELEARHTSTPVPPCRVCGAELTIASMGGGNATIYACADRPHTNVTSDEWYYHYSQSRFRQTVQGDPDVRELVAFVRRLHTNSHVELAFENAYDPPQPLSYQDLRNQDWLQANLARNLRLVKRRTVTYQTSWENASEDDLPKDAT